jgi:hypothetical protein
MVLNSVPSSSAKARLWVAAEPASDRGEVIERRRSTGMTKHMIPQKRYLAETETTEKDGVLVM